MSADLDDDILIDDEEQVLSKPRVPGTRRPATVTTSAPAPVATVGVSPVNGKTYLSTQDSNWTWRELRDYVIDMARKTHGQHIQRDPQIEKGVFSAFLNRHGAAQAVAIARYAFETSPHPGWWMQAPIRPSRFTKGADSSFADKIVAKL